MSSSADASTLISGMSQLHFAASVSVFLGNLFEGKVGLSMMMGASAVPLALPSTLLGGDALDDDDDDDDEDDEEEDDELEEESLSVDELSSCKNDSSSACVDRCVAVQFA
mmetsp:Transcript_121373/g.238488  ORF Transcript_121373/g.238488 Transcript_121373/m.238488 type:complete len:110 (-) Transcript_121373:270-599(-)